MRNRTRLLGLYVALAALALTTALWAAPAGAQRPNVSAALITLADLPAGWTVFDPETFGALPAPASLPSPPAVGPSLPTSAVSAEPDVDLSPACAMLLARFADVEDAEPLAEADAVFQRGALGPFLFHSVTLLPPGLAAQTLALLDAETLQAFFDTCVADLLRGLAEELGPDEPVGDLGISVQVTPLKVAQIGDQSVALRLDIAFGFLGTSVLMTMTRRGDALSALVLLADPNTATASAGMIEDLARRADARLAQVVGGR